MSRSYLRKDVSREFRIIVRGYDDRKLNEVRERFGSFVTLNAIGNAIEVPMIHTLAIIASSGISIKDAGKFLEEVRSYCQPKGVPQRSGEMLMTNDVLEFIVIVVRSSVQGSTFLAARRDDAFNNTLDAAGDLDDIYFALGFSGMKKEDIIPKMREILVDTK